MRILKLALLLVLVPAAVMAQEAQEETQAPPDLVTYSPDYCEFTASFPEEPTITKQCDSEDPDTCYDLVSFTQVYEMDATVDVRVICNPSNDDIYKSYDGEVMQATVKAMTEKNVIKTFDVSFREEDGYKQAGLVGEGRIGMAPTIYIAQLWIGKNSVMSVEAEMTGDGHTEADTLFSNILRSVYYLGEEQKAAADETVEDTEEKAEAN